MFGRVPSDTEAPKHTAEQRLRETNVHEEDAREERAVAKVDKQQVYHQIPCQAQADVHQESGRV